MAKRIIRWAGFSDGEPDLAAINGYGELYSTRAKARQFYTDVRKVEIREVKDERKDRHG